MIVTAPYTLVLETGSYKFTDEYGMGETVVEAPFERQYDWPGIYTYTEVDGGSIELIVLPGEGYTIISQTDIEGIVEIIYDSVVTGSRYSLSYGAS